mmetsp:Transcript_7550/g.30671  ORF Transcript_7550/g.30671 Transcript_7550/m.30671 type:complete len:284 (+) Transcript_7550:1595-2446(+)
MRHREVGGGGAALVGPSGFPAALRRHETPSSRRSFHAALQQGCVLRIVRQLIVRQVVHVLEPRRGRGCVRRSLHLTLQPAPAQDLLLPPAAGFLFRSAPAFAVALLLAPLACLVLARRRFLVAVVAVATGLAGAFPPTAPRPVNSLDGLAHVPSDHRHPWGDAAGGVAHVCSVPAHVEHGERREAAQQAGRERRVNVVVVEAKVLEGGRESIEGVRVEILDLVVGQIEVLQAGEAIKDTLGQRLELVAAQREPFELGKLRAVVLEKVAVERRHPIRVQVEERQ